LHHSGISMKHLFLLCPFFLSWSVFAQVAINSDGAAPDANAMLDISSSSKGLLIPCMTQTQMEAVGAPDGPATGMLVFNTSVSAFFFYDGTGWSKLGEVVADGDGSATNELQDLGSSVSGTNRTLTISGGTGTTISVADNDNDSTNEIQILSKSGTTVTLSNGGGSVSVIDGDGSATNELQTLGSAVNGTNRTLSISDGNSVTFSVADGDNDATNELDSKWNANGTDIYNGNSGNVGIGLTTPQQKLDVNGRLRIRADSPAAGDVLTALNNSGDARWERLSLHAVTGNNSTEYSRIGSGWWGIGFNVVLDGLENGENVLVLADFRCSLKGSGSGSDDPIFRVAISNPTGTTAYSDSTGIIETIDQHRDKWHHLSFQRTVSITQNGQSTVSLQINLDNADDRVFIDDLSLTVIKL
jgi:hypothetical protein